MGTLCMRDLSVVWRIGGPAVSFEGLRGVGFGILVLGVWSW